MDEHGTVSVATEIVLPFFSHNQQLMFHRTDDQRAWFVTNIFKACKTKQQIYQLLHDTKRSLSTFPNCVAAAAFMSSPVIGQTLMRAVETNCLEVIHCLIVEGADINMWFRGRTVLHEAVMNSDYPMMRHLLSLKEINKNKGDVEGKTPLMEAAQGKPECLKILLDAGCDHTIEDNQGDRAMHHLFNVDNLNYAEIIECLELFLKHGEDINQRCGRARTILHKSIEKKMYCIAEWCIRHNANFNAKMSYRHIICIGDDIGFHSLTLNPGDHTMYLTPLYFTIQNNDSFLLDILISCGSKFRHYVDVLDISKPKVDFDMKFRKHVSQIASLQALSRTVIREQLSTNICNDVKELELPINLQKYVMCKDELLALKMKSLKCNERYFNS